MAQTNDLMDSSKLFCIKDKVFAKVKGYSAWPGFINDIKMYKTYKKFEVVFLGKERLAFAANKIYSVYHP